MDTVINLMRNPIRILPADVPGKLTAAQAERRALAILPGNPAPLRTLSELDPKRARNLNVNGQKVPVIPREFSGTVGIPPSVPHTWYVVPFEIAVGELLYEDGRRDLLIVERPVYNDHGQIVGCRALARPL